MSHSTSDQNQQQNTEQWRDIPGYEGHYQVSDLGRVKSLARRAYRKDRYGKDSSIVVKERILKTIVTKRGYYQVTLSKDSDFMPYMVHRLVMSAFVSDLPKGHHTHHVDADPLNNRLSNLVYVPVNQHMGIGVTGTKAPAARLTRFLVKLIRIRLSKGEAARALAREYGVAQFTIRSIKEGLTWRSL